MAAWIPILKASLPYLTQVITAAIPAFTRKPPNVPPAEVVPVQIAELQTAVTQNAESLKALAVQLKETIERIESGSGGVQQELRRARQMARWALLVAVVSMGVAVWALSRVQGA